MVKLSNFCSKAYDAFCRGFALADEGRVEEAVAAYRIAAQRGAVDAQVNLATLLDDHVTPPRPQEALYWYRRAARLGYDVAAWNLAMHYSGIARRRWYVHWLNVANDLGHDDAGEELRTGAWWCKHNP